MKFFFVSLGCDKNLSDSEHIIAMMCSEGFEITDDEHEADVVIINTCCFIHDAKQESIDTICEMARLKEEKLKALIVCGCLAQRYSREILKEIPEVDAVVGTSSWDDLVDITRGVLGEEQDKIESAKDVVDITQKKKDEMPGIKAFAEEKVNITQRDTSEAHRDSGNHILCKPLTHLPRGTSGRFITTCGHYEYLKIAEGCNKHCTYCVIPSIRGPFRSVPMDELIEEAKSLAKTGVKELIIVAQETTLYGIDIYGKKMLPELLCKLSEIEGIEWIRLLYAYPEEVTDELIKVMSTNPKICHYIDIPIQHGSDNVLKKMGRRTNQAQIRDVVSRLREAMPDIAIRTTLISGFPGESQEDFEECYRFVNEMEFDRLGVFTYSREEGTPACDFDDQVPADISKKRRDELYELSQAIAFDLNEDMEGVILTVIVDGYLPEDDVYVTRSYKDAPDIDGMVFVYSNRELVTGDIIKVRITDQRDYDLEGVHIDESAE